MKSLKVLIASIMLISVNLLSVVDKQTFAAEQLNEPEVNDVVYVSSYGKILDSTGGEVSTNGIVASVAIFFGTVLVGHLIDGAIKYKTGYSATDWIAKGFHNMEAKIKSYAKSNKVVRIHVSNNGELSGCVSFPCAIKSSVPVLE